MRGRRLKTDEQSKVIGAAKRDNLSPRSGIQQTHITDPEVERASTEGSSDAKSCEVPLPTEGMRMHHGLINKEVQSETSNDATQVLILK